MNITKKTTYLLLWSTVMLSGCTQEDVATSVPDANDRKIVFHTSLPGLSTKAEVVTEISLPYFQVTAFNPSDTTLIDEENLTEYIINQSLNKTSESDRFTSDNCIWPLPGQESDTLHFFAFYPQLSAEASLVNCSKVVDGKEDLDYTIKDFSVASDIRDQVDFVTAYGTGSMENNLFSGITLGFRHQMSRIEVKAKGSHKSCNIEIAGVRIENVHMKGNFEFQLSDSDGEWTDLSSNGTAEYIFNVGDEIITVNDNAASILGNKADSYAMLIPSTYSAWDYANDATNTGEGIYLNVLLRIIDTTLTAGKGKQQYPYFDNSQGLNAMNIPRVYLAVNDQGIITANPGQLYKGNTGKYYTDPEMTSEYTAPEGSEVREFGWAALPIKGEWKPGYVYTYTLDYTVGVGLHGPDVKGSDSPKAGDPIISDKIGVSVSVKGWQTDENQVEVPGS